jgi:hypothetical protein
VKTCKLSLVLMACALMQVTGCPVAAHLLRRADESACCAVAMPQVHAAQQPDASINTLLRCLRHAHEAGGAQHAVAAALAGLAHDMDQV